MDAHRRLAAPLALIVVAAGLWIGARPSHAGSDDVARLVPSDVAAIDVTDWSRGDATDDSDLTARSVLSGAGEVIADGLGWTPETVRWEAFVQTTTGTAALIALPGSADATAERLRRVGYERDGTGLWHADGAALRGDGRSAPTVFTNVRLLPDHGVAVASEEPSVVEELADVAAGRSPSLADDPTLASIWSRRAGLAAYSLQGQAAGCASTDPAQAGEEVAAQARVAVGAVGELRAYRWLLRGMDARAARFEVAMAFDSGTQAAEQATTRARLSAGVFIGQTGDVEDSIVLRDHRASGDVAVLDFERQERAVALMSFTGPMVFASCPA
ncbi:MAG: hypothetical protein QM621_00725 [Aeromicrobium sp.]|uniref:hypothetical protein n=1 Tax=Aeromicrobium sp. TaxID=1871063 RepID=UPI0039E4ADF1